MRLLKGLLLPAAAVLALAGCADGPGLRVTPFEAPEATAPLALNLAADRDGRLAVSWLEPRAGVTCECCPTAAAVTAPLAPTGATHA